MPYARRYSKAKTSNKMFRKSYNKKKRMLFSKRQVKAIQKISQKSGELKKKELNFDSTGITLTSPLTASINGMAIAQGDGDDERIGDKLFIKDLDYKIQLSAGLVDDLVRVYIVQYDTDRTSYATSTNFPVGSGNDSIVSFMPDMDDTNGNKYKVLYDKVFKIGEKNNQENRLIKIHIPGQRLLNKYVEFDDTATTIIKGEIDCSVITNNTTATQIVANSIFRLRWYDS